MDIDSDNINNNINYYELSEKDKEEIRKNKFKGWNKQKQNTVIGWIDNLEYTQLIVYFHMFNLKKIENSWAWILIVLSALSSTISLIQFDRDRENLVLTANIFITIFTTLTTLIASWMKKQNYVQRIGGLEKYLQSLNIIISELQGQMRIHPEDRLPWKEFLDRYRDKVVEFDSSTPLISPEDWKETVYILTKYFPELTKPTFPWRDDDSWAENILKTYNKVKYRNWYNKICSLYFCSKKCKNNDNDGISDQDDQKGKNENLRTITFL
jgi:hypothetical protein